MRGLARAAAPIRVSTAHFARHASTVASSGAVRAHGRAHANAQTHADKPKAPKARVEPVTLKALASSVNAGLAAEEVAERSVSAADSSSKDQPTNTKLPRAPSGARVPRPMLRENKLAGSFTLKPARASAAGGAGTTTRVPRGFAPVAHALRGKRAVHSHATDARVVFDSAEDGKLAVGPGFLEYAGPAPVGDRAVMDSVRSVITYARLRDACPCPLCIHPTTRQKTHTSGEARRDVLALGNEVVDGTTMHAATNADGRRGLEVHWPVETGAPAHSSFYPLSLIRRLASGQVRGHTFLFDTMQRKLWDKDSLVAGAKDLHIDYAELNAAKPGEPLAANPEVLLRLLEQLHTYGLVVLRGVPTDKTANKECELRAVGEQIGLLRNTFYGETWDVKSVVNSKNVAYTNLNLGLHMDLLFQGLHCLRNRVVGGASYFVDSFQAAVDFEKARPELYAALQRNAIEYEYDNDGHYLHYSHPIVPKEPLTSAGLHTALGWSPPFQAPQTKAAKGADGLVPADPVEAARVDNEYYEAIDEFQATLEADRYRYEFTMKEGDLALFDNQRVLHARREFRDKNPEELTRDGTVLIDGEPTRWLKGCYLDGSTVWDRLAALNDSVRGAPRE